MRKLISASLLACALLLTPTLHAQQNAIMIQVLDGYTGVAIARHAVFISIGPTPADAKARRNPIPTYTDERGILMLPLPSGAPGWLQLWTSDMHACDLHPETDAFSLAEITSKGVQALNKCGKMSVKIAPAHFVLYMREFTAAERAATNRSSAAK